MGRCGFDPLPFKEGFYRAHAEAICFTYPKTNMSVNPCYRTFSPNWLLCFGLTTYFRFISDGMLLWPDYLKGTIFELRITIQYYFYDHLLCNIYKLERREDMFGCGEWIRTTVKFLSEAYETSHVDRWWTPQLNWCISVEFYHSPYQEPPFLGGTETLSPICWWHFGGGRGARILQIVQAYEAGN